MEKLNHNYNIVDIYQYVIYTQRILLFNLDEWLKSFNCCTGFENIQNRKNINTKFKKKNQLC